MAEKQNPLILETAVKRIRDCLTAPESTENTPRIPVSRSSRYGLRNMLAQLIPINGGHPIKISRDVTLVGRQKDLCDVCIERSSISKLHCVIVKTDGLLFIRDLGSTNGTKVNGQRVIRGALLPGDELEFAGEKFRIEMGPGEPESAQIDVQNSHTEIRESPRLRDPLEQFVPSAQAEEDSDSDVRCIQD